MIFFSKRVDNFFCEQECSKRPSGRLAIPQNRQQYDCITTEIKGWAQHGTPIWTGIRVRPNGAMFDPLTNENVTVFEKNHITLEASANKNENCVYLHNGHFVETKCTFVHNNRLPIQCGCVQGKQFPILLHKS